MKRFLVFFDALAAAAAIEVTAVLVRAFVYPTARIGFEETTASSLSVLLAALIVTYLVGLYDPVVLVQPRQVVGRAILVGALAGLAGMLAPYVVWYGRLGRITVVLVIILTAVFIAGWRLLYGRYLERGPRIQVIALGSGVVARGLATLVNTSRHTRYAVVGMLSARGHDGDEAESTVPMLGRLEDAAEIFAAKGVSNACIALEGELDASGEKALSDLQAASVRIMSAGAMAMGVAKQLPVEIVSVRWLLDGFDPISSPHANYVKRAIDIGLAIIGLTLFAVLAPLLFLMVKLDSRGPFIYRQPRVGLGGRIFEVAKIRTMTEKEPGAEQAWASQDSHRVTRVGKILRQLRLDEFPQFWNVLRGEMSVVGPRPEQPDIVDDLRSQIPHFQCRHLVKPGITGWAQIHGGYAGSLDASRDKLSYDLYYVRNYNALLDLDIILRTVFVMAARIGAR